MLIYAHTTATVTRRGSPNLRIPAGTWTEVADRVGAKLVEKDYICDVTGVDDPHNHVCSFLTSQITPAEMVTTRMSPQKRKLLRQSWHRSRNARIATRVV